ncbi:peptidase family M49-domain-containing protein [Hyaloraphidium curvatum]|nr:peptidase family M49-domain-containing protein [Hyaloraphidium curvatum]
MRNVTDASSISALYLADENIPICRLECAEHFRSLSPKEQLYAHHISRASFAGSRICLRQVSSEAEGIYDLVLGIFGPQPDFEGLRNASGVTDVAWKQFLDYVALFLANLGDYKSFGDTKFVPRLSVDDFGAIVAASKSDAANELFAKLKDAIYAVGAKETQLHLGFPDEGHVSNFYDPRITKEDIEAVQKALEANDISALNTRLFLDEAGNYQLRIASAEVQPSREIKTAGGRTIKLVYGDHQRELEASMKHLAEAVAYAANETQATMLRQYVEYFKTGDVKLFDESQKSWVKDQGPTVESNASFIETYRDPAGIRAEWEGFVAVVNKERSRVFAEMVKRAPHFLSLLPWGPEFEKEKFNPPDFTALEVISFATGGVPAGINIPNQDHIRQELGFKNVSLSNVLSAKSPNEKVTFLTPEDLALFQKYRGPAFEVQVACHELIGHGSGRVQMETAAGVYNFNKDHLPISPVTGKPIASWYTLGQTWNSVFTSISSTYEECRAEAVAMFLCCFDDVVSLFGHTDPAEIDDVRYVAWLQMARAGLLALEFYEPKAKKHGQAHMQARYAILQCFMRAGDGFVTIEETSDEDGPNLVVHLDRSKILTVGKAAIGAFLQKLHIYKMTADFENGSAFYRDHTAVPDSMLAWRDIVLSRKQPRKQFVQGNSFLKPDGTVEWRDYPETPEGLIQSWIERNV